VVGARPQFIKMGPVSRALAGHAEEVVVHTGQHYDPQMSALFFDELDIAEPAYHLGVGSGRHGEQTGRALAGVEAVILEQRPDAVVVYGDTNSTLAGALAAAKLHVPVAHVEAGLRSFNRAMPEEVNRVLTDHCSTLLFAPTRDAVEHLRREGIERGVQLVGDVMYDSALQLLPAARERFAGLAGELGIKSGGYLLATVHRAENTDDPVRLANILRALGQCGLPVILPLHPRTAAAIARHELGDSVTAAGGLRLIAPVGYLDMLGLESAARAILTDSGGVQKEAYFVGTPVVTVRDETEWVETVAAGWNQVVGTDPDRILAALAAAAKGSPIEDYGDGRAASRIVEALLSLDRASGV